MVKAAAETVERFDAGRDPGAPETDRRRTLTALALGILGLDRLVSDTAVDLLRRTVDDLGERIAFRHRLCL